MPGNIVGVYVCMIELWVKRSRSSVCSYSIKKAHISSCSLHRHSQHSNCIECIHKHKTNDYGTSYQTTNGWRGIAERFVALTLTRRTYVPQGDSFLSPERLGSTSYMQRLANEHQMECALLRDTRGKFLLFLFHRI